MIDRDRIEEIIQLLQNSSSRELAVRSGETYIRVRRRLRRSRELAEEQTSGGRAEQAEDIAAAAQPSRPHHHDHDDDDGDDEHDAGIVVKAPMVGRFYHGMGAGRPPLVKIGEIVEPEQAIGAIEALGKVTAVTAHETAEVIEFICEEGQAVGFGTPLIRLRKNTG